MILFHIAFVEFGKDDRGFGAGAVSFGVKRSCALTVYDVCLLADINGILCPTADFVVVGKFSFFSTILKVIPLNLA